jgi:SAM-dependent methyltransferase
MSHNMDPAPTAADSRVGDPARAVPRRATPARRLNTVCNLEDWEVSETRDTMRRILPYFLAAHPDYPSGMEHRKHWEFAQLLNGLDLLGVLREDAWVLAVAAGREEVAFDLTNRVRWVFCTDLYGTGDFSALEADPRILVDPDGAARCQYNRRRLVVQFMDALDLRYEDGTFDAAYSSSSIEHFGGRDGARRALAEQRRVVKPGGIVAFTTEVILNGAPSFDEGNLCLFTPEGIDQLCRGAEGLELVEPIDLSISDATLANVTPLTEAIARRDRSEDDVYPHIVMSHKGREWTSVAVFMRSV